MEVKSLLEAGAPPSAPADTVANVTPLHVAGRAAAALPGHDAKGVVQTLCDFGADLDARDSRGNTPLHAAAAAGAAAAGRGPARRGRRRRRAQHEPGHAAAQRRVAPARRLRVPTRALRRAAGRAQPARPVAARARQGPAPARPVGQGDAARVRGRAARRRGGAGGHLWVRGAGLSFFNMACARA